MIVLDPSLGLGNDDLFQKDEKALEDKALVC